MNAPSSKSFVFPRWANYLLPAAVVLAGAVLFCMPFLGGLAATSAITAVGYAPEQPIPFSHALHAGKLAIDCRYCHNTVERAAHAALPSTATCMTCHSSIRTDSPAIARLRESYESGMPVEWRRVHDLPDHAYFNHSIHVNKGIGCTTCHGPVHEMDVLRQDRSLSMAWCLDCHREPARYVRPRDAVTRTDWDPVRETGKTQLELGRELVERYQIQPRATMESCSTCHR
jgi:menaquinone reductase, multiheme cytochrome c subunit